MTKLFGFPTTTLLLFAIVAALYPNSSAFSQSSSPANRITVEARMTQTGEVLNKGVEWRIFETKESDNGKLEMLASAFGGAKSFEITPGEYVVHVGYGHAGAIRRVTVGGGAKVETFILNAGALKLDAVAGIDSPIPSKFLAFDVYASQTDDKGRRKLIAKDIKKDEIIPFPVGTYHVVSRFGNLNAEVRANLRVQPGSVTEASLAHRAGLLALRLVAEEGGDAIADTKWTVLTDSGAVIHESTTISPILALSEGNYSAIARNNDATYSKNFVIEAGSSLVLQVIAGN